MRSYPDAAKSRRDRLDSRHGAKQFKIRTRSPRMTIRSGVWPVPFRPGSQALFQHLAPRSERTQIFVAHAGLAQRGVSVSAKVNRRLRERWIVEHALHNGRALFAI